MTEYYYEHYCGPGSSITKAVLINSQSEMTVLLNLANLHIAWWVIQAYFMQGEEVSVRERFTQRYLL